MSQISKCPRVTVVLSYFEASGEVSKLSFKSLLFDSSRRSYCKTKLQTKSLSVDKLVKKKYNFLNHSELAFCALRNKRFDEVVFNNIQRRAAPLGELLA